jgi:hypothetical protein
MATIAEIRAQYPQYSDMSDAALADALHKKFYSDMPRADFDIKVGLQPAPRSEGMPTAPRQELTAGQRMYQSIRPYVAPTIEAIGAAGGALLGAPLGPPGVVGGAGLGYGLAKETLELGDVYLGGKEPRKGAAIAVEPAKNILEGATYEAGGRVVAPLLGKAIGKVADLKNIPQNKAAEIARNALGPDLPEVINALKAAQGQNVSAAQATAAINSPTWQALIDRATARDPRFLRALEQSQGETSLNALSRLVGGATATDVRATTDTMKQTLRDITSPARQAALNRANLGQQVAQYEAEAGKLSAEATAKVQDVRRLINAGNLAEASARLDLIKRNLPVGLTKYTYKGDLARMADEWASKAADASLDLGQGARFAQSAADSLREAGIKPLKGEAIIGQIRGVLNNPEFAGNDLLSGAAKNIANDIAQWTKNGGIIDARALDAIRKNSINATVQQLRPGVDATTQRNLAAKVTSEIKPTLINAIEAAGGKGYREYLDEFSKGMQKIAETKLTGEAVRLWKTDKDAFVRLVQNESPDVVEKFLGPGNYNIATELSDNVVSTLQSQAQKHLANLSVKGQVSAGQDALKQLLLDNTSKLRIPSYLSAVATTTNKALNILENKIGTKTMGVLTEALKTPGSAANLLERLPIEERNRVVKLISDPSSLKSKAAQRAAEFMRSGASTTAINALASEPSENALID